MTLCVLEDISALEEVSTTYALHAHRFATILPILDRAVSDGVDFGEARRRTELADRAAKRIDIGRGGGGAGAGRGANPGRVGRPPRACNRLNFGLDYAMVDDPYDLSDIGGLAVQIETSGCCSGVSPESLKLHPLVSDSPKSQL